MTHRFHSGRYSGKATIPDTGHSPVLAAALVVTHLRLKVAPMFAQLALGVAVGETRLVPVQVVDFYRRDDPTPLDNGQRWDELAAIEREHFGDPDKQTGVYAKRGAQ